MSTIGDKSFVIFPLGGRRFAFPADDVTELAKPDRLQVFPHRTKMLTGVLVRRGRIVPVLDIAQVLVGPDAPPRKFYLIVNRQCNARPEWTAIPVTGECELANAELIARPGTMPQYASGFLSLGGEVVEVVALNTFDTFGDTPDNASSKLSSREAQS